MAREDSWRSIFSLSMRRFHDLPLAPTREITVATTTGGGGAEMEEEEGAGLGREERFRESRCPTVRDFGGMDHGIEEG